MSESERIKAAAGVVAHENSIQVLASLPPLVNQFNQMPTIDQQVRSMSAGANKSRSSSKNRSSGSINSALSKKKLADRDKNYSGYANHFHGKDNYKEKQSNGFSSPMTGSTRTSPEPSEHGSPQTSLKLQPLPQLQEQQQQHQQNQHVHFLPRIDTTDNTLTSSFSRRIDSVNQKD